MAGNNFNPNSPSTVGLEWLTDVYGEYALGSWAQRIRSLSAESINVLNAFLHPASQAFDASVLQADIIPAGQEIPSGTISTATFQPNADVTLTNFTGTGVAPIYQYIDEGVDSVNLADFVVSLNTTSSVYAFHVASNGFSGTGRVLNVQIRLVAATVTGGASLSVQIGHVGGSHGGRLISCNTTPTLYTIDFGEIRSATGPTIIRPWTFTDIRGFDTIGNTETIRLELQTQPANIRIYACELVVTYQTIENRVAAATHLKDLTTPSPPPASYNFQAFTPLPGPASSWSKPASGDFTVLFRPPYHPLGMNPPTTFALNWTASHIGAADIPCSVPGVVSARPVLDSYGQVVSVDFTDPVQSTRTAAIILRRTDTAVSQDSLPYVLASLDAVNHFPDVNNGQNVNQRFTATASTTYKFIKLLVNPGVAIDDLNVRIRRQSDALQFGSTGVVRSADVQAQPADGNGLRKVRVTFATGATLVNGTQYRVELTSTDSMPSGTGWRTVIAGHQTLVGGAATYGGTTDFPLVGAVTFLNNDMPFALSTPPTPPAGTPVAVVTNTANNVFAPIQTCVPTAIQAVTLTWSATALGVLFDHYDVQRRPVFGDDGDWQFIGATTNEAATSFTDYETPRGVPVEYQVRVVRSDLAESDWTTASNGATAQALGCDMIFTSNENPTLNCAFVRDPLQDYIFQEAARDELVQIYGSNNSVAFMECEDAGIQVAATLTVNFGRQPVVADVQIYDPIRRISRAALSYVCVLDHVGNRFLGHVQFGAGKWEEPGFRYHGDVVVTEVTQTSSIAVR